MTSKPITATLYRGYELEHKALVVGWQIAITKEGTFVQNGAVFQHLQVALDDAHSFVDGLLACSESAAPGTAPR
jgi:hypothetical protein